MDSQLFPSAMRARSPAPEAIVEAWVVPEVHEPDSAAYRHVELGDQGYFWALLEYRPDMFFSLPLRWEVGPVSSRNAAFADDLASV